MVYVRFPINVPGLSIKEGDIVSIGSTSHFFLGPFFAQSNKNLVVIDKVENAEDISEISAEGLFKHLNGYEDYFFQNKFKMFPEKLRTDVLIYLQLKNRGDASELLVNYIKSHYKICTVRDDDHNEVWIYQKGIYVPNGKTYISEIVRNVLGAVYTSNLANLVIDKIMNDTYIHMTDFFQYERDINLLPLQNGLFNLETGELLPFDDTKVFFRRFPIFYDKNKDCPAIKKFVTDISSCNNDFVVIQEIFGWLLFKNYAFEKIIMFLGDGRNGKSKIIELIKYFVGPDNISSLPPSILEDPSEFAISSLYSKIANLAPDIPTDGLKRTSVLKTLSGNDIIEAKRKFKSTICFKNTAKLIFGANELPITYDTKAGFWERWILLEFPYKFIEKDKFDKDTKDRRYLKERDVDIIDKLIIPSEMSGLFNWAYEGYLRLKKNKQFSYRHSSEEVRIMWTRKSNSFAAFIMDSIEFDYDSKIIKRDLKKAYVSYCKYQSLKTVSDKLIFSTLSNEGVSDDRIMVGENFERVWTGIKFKSKFEKHSEINAEISKFNPNYMKTLVYEFIEKGVEENYHDLCQRFGEENIKRMINEGELIENPMNCVRVNR